MAGDPTRTTIIMMAGYPGAGKTTLANLVQSQTGMPILSRDALKRANLAAGLDPWKAVWDAHISLIEHVKIHCLQKRNSLIIDFSNLQPFISERILHAILCMGPEHPPSVQIKTIFCVAPQEERARRIKLRGSVFAPYSTSLPIAPGDEELSGDFDHLLREHEDVRTQLKEIINARLFREFESFLSVDGNMFVANTLAFHELDIWQKLKVLISS